MLGRIINRLQEVCVVAKKELTHCLRDAHVLIHSIILPLVLYPVLIIGLSEYMLWRDGLSEKQPLRVAIDVSDRQAIDDFISALQASKKIKLVQTNEPMKELESGRLEGVLQSAGGDKLTMLVNPSSDRVSELKLVGMGLTFEADSKAMDKAIKASGKDPSVARVFDVGTRSVRKFGEKKYALKGLEVEALSSNVLLVALYTFGLLTLSVSSIYPALAAFTEEIEKRTKVTTFLLPIERSTLVSGKFISVYLLSMASGLLNIASLSAVVCYLAVRIDFFKQVGALAAKQMSFTNVLLVLGVFLLSCAFVASLYSLMAAQAKSFKEAQNTSTLPLLICSLVPTMAMIPGWNLDARTALVPILNMVLVMKAIITESAEPYLIAIAFLEMIVASVIFLYFAQRIFWGRDIASPELPTIK